MKIPTPDTIELWGGTLCLDLANSTDWDAHGDEVEPEHNDVLLSAELLARWARRLGVLAEGGAREIADDELHRVRDLRASIHSAFSAIAAGADPDAGDLLRLHESVAEATAAGELEPAGGGWRWTWPGDDPRRVRFAVAVDAVSLLTDAGRLGRVVRCPGHDCGWLFLDRTGRRRWCSMAACGSREKMRRLYARRKAA
jgi:predicted RNA-binding Zn ribbon-like protein